MSPSSLVQDLTDLSSRVDGHDKKVVEYAAELIEQYGAQLKGLKWMASQRFRASSEKVAPGQLTMDFIAHLLAQSEQHKAAEAVAQPEARTPRKKRKSKLDVLPVKQVDKTLPEADRQCACGECKQPMGHDTSRQIIYEPAKLFMLEERVHKYACRPCGDGVVAAKATPKLIPGGLASSSLLAHLTVAKVEDCTPIERIGKQLARHGADIAPSTLYDWFAQAGREAEHLLPHIKKDMLASKLISLDDTPFPAKNNEHPKHIQRGRLWLYIGDVDRVAFCQFTEDWKGKHPRGVLEAFTGDVQGDGYGGISALFHGADPPSRFGCNDHARRKFYEAMRLGDSRAEKIVSMYAQLYAVERGVVDADANARLEARQSNSKALWTDLAQEIRALDKGASPKGPLGKALTYWKRQEPTLSAFLDNGHVPISNAHVERLLRTVALLRKNTLFVGSIEAGHRYAALLTLALNCALCGANSFEYFSWLFDRLADGVFARDALSVMPQAWIREQQTA